MASAGCAGKGEAVAESSKLQAPTPKGLREQASREVTNFNIQKESHGPVWSLDD
jgi:hypothetical protein